MKKSSLIIIFIVAVIIIFGGWYLLFSKNNPLTNSNKANSNISQINLSANVNYENKLAYKKITASEQGDNYELYITSKEGNKKIIYSFTNPQDIGEAIFRVYGQDKIAIYRAGKDDTNQVLDYKGNKTTLEVIPNSDFVFSPDLKRVAYIKTDFDKRENTKLIVLDLNSNIKEEYPANIENEFKVFSHLRPIAWSSDGSRIYADIVMYTSGCVPGLYEIDRNNKKVVPLDVFKDLKICNPTVYPKENLALGYKMEEDNDLSKTEVIKNFYKVDLASQTYSQLTLTDSRVRGPLLLSPSENYITYQSDNFETWITNLNEIEEKKIVQGNPVTWSDETILAIDKDMSMSEDFEEIVYVYDPITQKLSKIDKTNTFSERLEVIGWLKVPK